MPRQNPNLLGASSDLRSAAAAIRAAISDGSFEALKQALTATATAFEQAQGAIEGVESRLRDAGQLNTPNPGRRAPILLSTDRLVGTIPASTIDGTLGVTHGGTGTATGSITGTGSLVFSTADSAEQILLNQAGGRVVIASGGAVVIVASDLSPQFPCDLGTTAHPWTNLYLGTLSTSVATLTCANGANNNLTLPAATYVRVAGPTALYNITGFVAGHDGQHLLVWNSTGFGCTLKDQNAGSTAANRIFTTTGVDLNLGTFGFASLIYDTTSAFWVVMSHT